MKTKFIFTYLLLLLFVNSSLSQPEIQWETNFGGSLTEWSHRVINTDDGHIMIAGSAESSDGDLDENNGSKDGLVLLMDNVGNVIWKKTFGGTGLDFFFDMEKDRDGGYLLFGTGSSSTELPGFGLWDIWLVKIDQDGNLMWQKKYGGAKSDVGYEIELTSDGGYIIFGETNSNVGNFPDSESRPDAYIIKLDADANIEWEQTYGGSSFERGLSILEVADGGFIASGRTRSTDRDVTSNPGGDNYWIFKVDSDGVLMWDKTILTNADTWDISMTPGDDDSVILAATDPNDDYLIIKMAMDGEIIWERTYGGSEIERIHHITNTKDGGYIIGGQTYSSDGDISVAYGDRDCWIVKLDNLGMLKWEKTLGGTMEENSTDIDQIDDNCYIISNASNSSDNDVSENNGEHDIWVVKLCDGVSGCTDDEELDIQLEAEDLACSGEPTEIVVFSNFDLDSISWTGPSNEGLVGLNLLISEPGEYTLTGYSGECVNSISIFIEDPIVSSEQSYSICEGDSLVILNAVFMQAGTYQLVLSTTEGCDSIVNIDLQVIEEVMAEESYLIQAGESLDINGTIYDMEGQYMQTLVAASGCDSILIINIDVIQSLITYDFDACKAFDQTMSNADYSEFTPRYDDELDCGTVTASNIYREEPLINKHSCTGGLNESPSMCISSEESCEFDMTSTKKVLLNLEINPDPNSKVVLTALEFYQQAPEMFSWLNGDSGPNNYPTRYGLRIMRNDTEIFRRIDNATTLMWQKEDYSFLNNDDFVFDEPTTLQIQLLPYCPAGIDSPVTAWDLEDLRIFGSCTEGDGSKKVISGTVKPYATEVLDNVMISIIGNSEINQIETNEKGKFSQLSNLQNGQYKISAFKDDDYRKGVNGLDLLMIQRHLLGLDNFENPLKIIAADIDYDSKVSVRDLRELRKLILGIYDELPSNYSYRFLNQKDVDKENILPWDISETIEIAKLEDHMMDADFVPVKIGDVTGMESPYSTSSKRNDLIALNIEKQQTNSDKTGNWIFSLEQPMALNGLHMSIDLKNHEFEGLESPLENFGEVNYHMTDERILNIIWTDAVNYENVSSHLFTLKLRESNTNDLLDEFILSEVYVDDKAYELEPRYEETSKMVESISKLKIYPNPVKAETIISFVQNETSDVDFSILNIDGKIVYNEVIKTVEGINNIQLPDNMIHLKNGTYIIRLTDQSSSLFKKIVVAN